MDYYTHAVMGDTIDLFAHKIVELAKVNKWHVRGNFNGIMLDAIPDMEVSDVMKQWNEATKPLPPLPPPTRSMKEGEVPGVKEGFDAATVSVAAAGFGLIITGIVLLWGWPVAAIVAGGLLFFGAMGSRPK